MRRILAACAAFVLLTNFAAAENWPGWRGPDGMGHSADANPPLTWSQTENVRWKVDLPDTGNATPVVWGNRVFVTQATAKGTKRGVICLNRENGKLIWKKYVDFTGQEPTHDTNPYGSASPATDGERVVVSLGSAGVYCWDVNGHELWKKDLGEFIHIWGTASSPVIHGDLVYLWCGPGERQFLVAWNKKTGDEVWRKDVPGGRSGIKGKDKGGAEEWIGSWSTPVIAKVGDREELILSVPHKVIALDPKTGKDLWWCDGLGPLVYTSPVVSDDGIVLAMAGYHGAALAVKAGGTGDVTKTHRLWHHTEKNPQRIGTAVILGRRAYMLNEQGLASCFDLKTGKDLWNQERVSGQVWGSMVSAAGRLYVTNTAGETLVLKPGDEPEVLARNKLGERVLASIAMSDGEVFIRGYKHLWCIGGKR